MSDKLPIDRARKNKIESSIRSQEEDAKKNKISIETDRVIIRGRKERLPIYLFDTNDLVFNRANGRIKSEIYNKEANLGRDLTDNSDDDQKIIREILLSIRQDENEKISKDIEEKGQLKPGIVTCDGVVINGNRRKAILQNLYDETSIEKYKYIECHVLPSNIKKSELWLIEAGIQMSADQQLDYSPINNMLKFKEGINSGLTAASMASGIYGVRAEDIEKDIDRLDLIDEYLTYFLRKKNRYYLIDKLNEHFINLQDILNWAEHPRGRVRLDWEPDASDLNELKLVAFHYIRLKFPHLRIREIRNLFGREDAWLELKKTLDIEVDDNEIAIDKEDDVDDIADDLDDIEEELAQDNELLTNAQIQKDLMEEKNWINLVKHELKSRYQDAKEQEQIQKDTEQPELLAKRALKNINAIPHDEQALVKVEMDDLLSEIIKSTNELRKISKKVRNH